MARSYDPRILKVSRMVMCRLAEPHDFNCTECALALAEDIIFSIDMHNLDTPK
jgi:hypothetical protein